MRESSSCVVGFLLLIAILYSRHADGKEEDSLGLELFKATFGENGKPLFPKPIRGIIDMVTGNGTGAEIRRCDRDTGYSAPYIGHVTLEPLKYCDVRTFRFIKGVTCCGPQPPNETFPAFRLYLPGQENPPNGTILDWRDPSEVSKIMEGKVIFLIHGWSENVNTSVWLRKAVDGWTCKRNTQVIVVDWHEGNKYYFQTIANVRTIGKVIGYALINWNLLDRADLVGHSAGAHVIGEAGTFVKAKGKKIRYCVGLDPAGPLFDGGSDDIRLTKDDCEVVVGVHSSAEDTPLSAGVFNSKFGTYYRIGQCDYWINCGRTQGPDCRDGTLAEVLNHDGTQAETKGDTMCSHHIAPLIYASQVNLECDQTFEGQNCSDCSNTIRGDKCTSSQKITRGFIPDADCKPNELVDFNVPTPTSYSYPYCKRKLFV